MAEMQSTGHCNEAVNRNWLREHLLYRLLPIVFRPLSNPHPLYPAKFYFPLLFNKNPPFNYMCYIPSFCFYHLSSSSKKCPLFLSAYGNGTIFQAQHKDRNLSYHIIYPFIFYPFIFYFIPLFITYLSLYPISQNVSLYYIVILHYPLFHALIFPFLLDYSY